jgi:putative transposase
MRFAQRFNRQRGWTGLVWQGRYFSSALDEHYLRGAIRTVERNPVRAKMVKKAENYTWSSAAAHCAGKVDGVLTTKAYWKKQFESIADCSSWLAEGDTEDELSIIRRNIDKGLPCGSERFIKTLEKQIGRVLEYRPLGRPVKQERDLKGSVHNV